MAVGAIVAGHPSSVTAGARPGHWRAGAEVDAAALCAVVVGVGVVGRTGDDCGRYAHVCGIDLDSSVRVTFALRKASGIEVGRICAVVVVNAPTVALVVKDAATRRIVVYDHAMEKKLVQC